MREKGREGRLGHVPRQYTVLYTYLYKKKRHMNIRENKSKYMVYDGKIYNGKVGHFVSILFVNLK